ncbi:MAG: isoprenylcysteine carboxylmethyltransferase family protein [Candidatus Omnitrophota bacterium]
MKKRLKINGIIMAGAALAIAFFPKLFLRAGNCGGVQEEVLGFALIFLGQIIRVSARGYKAEHSQDSQALIQGGPYQVVRNPMYLGIFLIGLGVVLAIFRWWVVIVFIAVFILRYLLLIDQEEKKLGIMFPQAYPPYCQKVPRIFPSLFNIIKLDIIKYLPIKIIWFKKEIGSMVTLLLLVLLVRSWQEIAQAGLKTYLQQLAWIGLTFILFIIFVILLSKRTNRKNESRAS